MNSIQGTAKAMYTNPNFCRVLYLSLLTMMFQGLTNSNLGIVGQFADQNGNKWVGPLSISLLFLGSGVSSLYNKYIRKYSYKMILFSGACGYIAFLTFPIIFLYTGFSDLVCFIILFGSLLCGCIVSVYYNGLFNYVDHCSELDHDKRYYSLFLTINQSANIIGNFISAFLIEPLSQNYFSILMAVLCFLCSFGYLGVHSLLSLTTQPPFTQSIQQYQQQRQSNFIKQQRLNQQIIEHKQSRQIIKQKQNTQTIEHNQNKCYIQTKQEQQIKEHEQNKQSILKGDRNPPLSLFLSFGFSGVIISFVYSGLSLMFLRAYPASSNEELNRMTFIAFLIEGAGELTGGIVLTLFVKSISSTTTSVIIVGQLFLAGCVVAYFGELNANYPLLCIAAFIVGVADCIEFSLLLSIAGKWREKGNSLFNIAQSGIVAIFVAFNIFIPFPFILLLYVAAHLLCSLSLLTHQTKINSLLKYL